MAQLSFMEKSQARGYAKRVLALVEHDFGTLPNAFKMMAYSPGLLGVVHSFLQALQERTQLDPRLRELAYRKTSQLNHCEYYSRLTLPLVEGED
jgi:alkylhydroperoxidase family enzyme